MTPATIRPASRRRSTRADYEGFRARQEAARKEGRYIGLGIGNAVEATGLGPYESATVRVSTSGKITVYTGATPQGQSHKTTLAQIAADHFGCTPDDITIVCADTAATGLGVGSFAARTAVNAGSSVHLASAQVATKIRQFAAQAMEVAEHDVVLENGFAKVAGSDLKQSFREVAARRGRQAGLLHGRRSGAGAGAHQPVHARPVDLLQRHPHRRGRGRHRDRAGDGPALRRDARLRPCHQSDGGGRPGGRRRGPRRRQRVLRAHDL